MPNDKLITFGNCNSCVRRDYEIWNGLHCYGVVEVNANNLKPLEFCSEHNFNE